MKHGRSNRTFGRVTKQRKALFNSLAVSLIKHDKIKTTEAKAKELKPIIEKMIQHGKKGDLAAFRHLKFNLPLESARRLIKEISPRFTEVSGGYTRIYRLPPRTSDGAKMAIIEFTRISG